MSSDLSSFNLSSIILKHLTQGPWLGDATTAVDVHTLISLVTIEWINWSSNLRDSSNIVTSMADISRSNIISDISSRISIISSSIGSKIKNISKSNEIGAIKSSIRNTNSRINSSSLNNISNQYW